jgi:hypothetical protein
MKNGRAEYMILDYIEKNGGTARSHEILDGVEIGSTTMFGALRRLVDDGKLLVEGKRPNTVWSAPKRHIPQGADRKTAAESIVRYLLNSKKPLSRPELVKLTGYEAHFIKRCLFQLREQNMVRMIGKKSFAKYEYVK